MTPMTRTGHRHLPDGLLLRVDRERRNPPGAPIEWYYIGSLYRADLTVKRVAVGASIDEVNRQIANW
jgi:hypothetical protein